MLLSVDCFRLISGTLFPAIGGCCLSSESRIIEHQTDIAFETVSTREILELCKELGRSGLSVDALFQRFLDGPVDGCVDDVRIHGILLRDRVGDEHTSL